MKHYIIIAICFLALSSLSFEAMAQGGTIIQGTVISAADRSELIGVIVTEIDATGRVVSGAAADFNGQYVIRVANTQNRLVFSYLGYKKQTVTIGNQTTINITLEEDNVLQTVEVVATKTSGEGGFVIPTREIGVAAQTISAKEFEGIQTTSLDDALQGRIAGLDIVSNSGDPGAPASMRIRGASSITGNNEPLIVMNGIPYSIDVSPDFDYANSNEEQYANMLSINVEDVLEITVLKDAAATAIWGSRGANGVISIKTKRGVSGPTRADYSYKYTRAEQPRGLNMLSGDDYTMYMKEAYLNPRQDDNATNIPEFNYDPNFPEFQNFNNNTDWVKEVSQIGHIHDHYVTISGGGERGTFRFSGGYLTQDGTVIGQNLERISSRLNFEYRISDRIKVISETSFTYTDNHKNYDNLLGIAYAKMPNVSVYAQDIFGNNTNEFYNIHNSSVLHDDQKRLRNPVALAHLATNRVQTTNIMPHLGLQYDLLDPEKHLLRLTLNASFDTKNDKTESFLPGAASNLVWNHREVNRAFDATSERVNVFTDNTIRFVPKFANTDHALTLYGAMQLSTGNGSSQSITTFGLPSGEAIDASNFGTLEGFKNDRSSWRNLSFLTSGHYAYKGKYIVTGTVRREGSTRFGKGNKWGNFPGVSLKWIISDEDFMKSTNKWLSTLAIRPSWGISGNQPKDDYMHFSRYGLYGSYLDLPGMRPASLRLDNLRWEKVTQFNYGFELGLFNNRYYLDFNYYTKRTEDMLFPGVPIPTSSGFTEIPYINGGIMDNKGWDLALTMNRFIKINDFSMDFMLNLADNKNTLVEMHQTLLDTYNSEFNFRNGSYLTRIQENNSFGSIYGFRFKGTYKYDTYEAAMRNESTVVSASGKPLAPVAIDAQGNVILDERGMPKPLYYNYNGVRYMFRGGDAIYQDINNDGSIDELDIMYLGNSNPILNGGFGPTFRYKNLSCRTFFNFRYGNKIINQARMNAENMYGNNNQSTAVNWRWRKDGDETDMPRALYNYGYNWLGSDRYVEDGSFLRLKYVTFNYAVPKSTLDKWGGVKRLSFYLTINNLFVWTKYTGVDPEVGYGTLKDNGLSVDKSMTPRTKDFTLGISVGL